MKRKEPKPLPDYPFITPDDYKEFRAIIKKEYGVELSEDESIHVAKRLLSLYELITRPLPTKNPNQADG